VKINGSWKFILSALAVLGMIVVGMRSYSWFSLRNFVLTPAEAKEVNLVAIQPGKGYRVIVANRIAQLGEVEESEDGRGGFGGGDVQNAQNLRRIPVRELLGSLNADPMATGYLIERMNELNGPDDPPSEYKWQEEDLIKALDGDPVLRRKLEIDLQCTMDGAPIDSFSASRIFSGISIITKVPIEVLTGDKMTTVQAVVRQPYKSPLAAAVEKELNERFNPTPEQMLSAYLTKAKVTPTEKDSVAKALRARISPERKAELSAKPERIVGSAMVLANTDHFITANSRSYKAGNGKDELTDLTLKVTDEGRKRLWKYSMDKVKSGFQLMFVVDGVAFAAPKIATELAESEIKITQMPDRALAETAVNRLKELKAKG
jgi:hypothetical protein